MKRKYLTGLLCFIIIMMSSITAFAGKNFNVTPYENITTRWALDSYPNYQPHSTTTSITGMSGYIHNNTIGYYSEPAISPIYMSINISGTSQNTIKGTGENKIYYNSQYNGQEITATFKISGTSNRLMANGALAYGWLQTI